MNFFCHPNSPRHNSWSLFQCSKVVKSCVLGVNISYISNLIVSYKCMVTSIISSNGFYLFVFLMSGLDLNVEKKNKYVISYQWLTKLFTLDEKLFRISWLITWKIFYSIEYLQNLPNINQEKRVSISLDEKWIFLHHSLIWE
jgi:hypothetical protein